MANENSTEELLNKADALGQGGEGEPKKGDPQPMTAKPQPQTIELPTAPIYGNDNPESVEQADAKHAERIKKYGEGYVVTSQRGFFPVFTKTAWEKMDGKGDMKQASPWPPEVVESWFKKKAEPKTKNKK